MMANRTEVTEGELAARFSGWSDRPLPADVPGPNGKEKAFSTLIAEKPASALS